MHMVANTNASLRDGETPSSENSLALAPISVVDNSTLSLSLSLSLSLYLSFLNPVDRMTSISEALQKRSDVTKTIRGSCGRYGVVSPLTQPHAVSPFWGGGMPLCFWGVLFFFLYNIMLFFEFLIFSKIVT